MFKTKLDTNFFRALKLFKSKIQDRKIYLYLEIRN